MFQKLLSPAPPTITVRWLSMTTFNLFPRLQLVPAYSTYFIQRRHVHVGILKPAIVLFPQCVVHNLKKQMKLASWTHQSAIVILAVALRRAPSDKYSRRSPPITHCRMSLYVAWNYDIVLLPVDISIFPISCIFFSLGLGSITPRRNHSLKSMLKIIAHLVCTRL